MLVDFALGHLDQGAGTASRGAELLHHLYARSELAQTPASSLVDKVTDLLPTASPELGRSLGLATQTVAGDPFKDVLRSMHKSGEQGSKETASAFESERRGR